MESIITPEEINNGAYTLFVKNTTVTEPPARKIFLQILIIASPGFLIGMLPPFFFDMTTKESGLWGKLLVGFLCGLIFAVIILFVYLFIKAGKRNIKLFKHSKNEWVRKYAEKLREDAIKYEDSMGTLKEDAKKAYEEELANIDATRNLMFAKAYEAEKMIL